MLWCSTNWIFCISRRLLLPHGKLSPAEPADGSLCVHVCLMHFLFVFFQLQKTHFNCINVKNAAKNVGNIVTCDWRVTGFFPIEFWWFFHLVDTLSEAYVAYAWYQRTSVEMLNMQMEFKIEFNTLVAQSNFYSINGNSSPSWDTASE